MGQESQLAGAVLVIKGMNEKRVSRQASNARSVQGPRIAGRKVDLVSGEIHRQGETTRVSPKAAALLALLLERQGEVVGKGEILDRVWADAYVTDDGLWHAIAELRRAFGDDPKAPRVIETLPRRGYRLIAQAGEDSAAVGAVQESRKGLPDEPLQGDPCPDDGKRQGRWLSFRWPRIRRRQLVTVLILLVFARGALTRLEREAEDSSGLLEQGLAAFERYTSGYNERAIELLEKAVDAEPDLAPGRAALADAYSFKALFFSVEPWWKVRAVEEAERAVELDPNLPEAHKALGLARVAAGDRRAARRAYRRAIALRPVYPQALNNLGLLESRLGNLGEGAWLFQQAVQAMPQDAAYLSNLGTIQRLLGLRHQAEATFEAAQALPDQSRASSVAWQRALLDFERGAKEAGRLRLARALDREPRNRGLVAHAAEVALHLGRREEALALLRRELAPQGGPDEIRLALLYVAAGGELGERLLEIARGVQARGDGNEIRLDPGRAMERSMAELALGDQSRALDWLELAVQAGFRERVALGVDPVFSSLWDDPRFQELLRDLATEVDAQRMAYLARSAQEGASKTEENGASRWTMSRLERAGR